MLRLSLIYIFMFAAKQLNLYNFNLIYENDEVKKTLNNDDKVLFLIDHTDLPSIILYFLLSKEHKVDLTKACSISSSGEDGKFAAKLLKKKGIEICQRESLKIKDGDLSLAIKKRSLALKQFITLFKKKNYALMAINEKSKSNLPLLSKSPLVIYKLTGCKIMVVSATASFELRIMKNWDSIKVPFGKVNLHIGGPISFDEKVTNDRDLCLSIIEEKIKELRSQGKAEIKRKINAD